LALVSSTATPEPPRKKKKGPKGPNPLSVKKKKKIDATTMKTKGKDKDMTSGSRKPVVHEDDKAQVGEKRKRAVDGGVEQDEGQATGRTESSELQDIRRKRKRQRKRVSSSTN
jgi:U3 small nucleolar RNA-associated protein 23